MLGNERPNSPKLPAREAVVAAQFHRFQPEFCRPILAIDVNMRWLNPVEADEVEMVGARNVSNARHGWFLRI